MTEALDLNGAHWAFSLAVYGHPGVPESCLFLQDEYGLDVNIMLLGLYAVAKLGKAGSADEIAMLDDSVRPLRDEVVIPLRKVRRTMKDMATGREWEAVRNQVKANELRAEQLEQAVLAKVLAKVNPSRETPDLTQAAERIVAYFAARSGVVACHHVDKAPAKTSIATIVAAVAKEVGT